MTIIPKEKRSYPKCFSSIYDPDFLKEEIAYHSSEHDWQIKVSKNYAQVIAANNHKFDVYFSANLQYINCSCKKFAEDELNWCQHCVVVQKWMLQNKTNNDLLFHKIKPDFIFYNGVTQKFYNPNCNETYSLETVKNEKAFLAIPLENICIYNHKVGINPEQICLLPNIKLYPYQEDACRHMLNNRSSILALEMGWGKTLCAINNILHVLKENPNATVLILCPKSLKKQWEQEIKKYIKISVELKEQKSFSIKRSQITISHYEMARDFENSLCFDSKYDVIILDEVQKIKNKNTQAWKGISLISADWIWALSGTVIENNVEDFLAIVDILKPNLFKSRWKFYNKYCNVDRKYVTGFKITDDFEQMQSSIIYKAPADQAPVDVKLDKYLIQVPMTPQQASYHNNIMGEVNRLLAISGTRPLTFPEQVKLAGLQTNARKAADGLNFVTNSNEIPIKIKRILELISKIPGKIIIFSEWKEFLSILERQFSLSNYRSIRFDGDLSADKRQQVIQEFIKNPEIKFFCSTDAGGIGVDGLQYVSDIIIHCQNVWNPAKKQQRDGRLVRIGQKKDVKSYMFVSQDSIEMDMEQNHVRKNFIKNALIK